MSELSNLKRPSIDPPTTRWVGIDEAGYGPNLGPLVMTAVIAEGPADRPPSLWNDLAGRIARAGCADYRLWVDDSKRVYSSGRGRDRLEAATFAALAACGVKFANLGGLLSAVGADEAAHKALCDWLEGRNFVLPTPSSQAIVDAAIQARPFDDAPWRLIQIQSVILDAGAFNQQLDKCHSKADLHFDVFACLLRPLVEWGGVTSVRGDKHGGRHYYQAHLASAFPDRTVDRVEESPGRSRYVIRGDKDDARLSLELTPRADADDGLVALASIVSKTIRELWMEAFNSFWSRRIPGIRPTAGYPQDARRFRSLIEESASQLALDPSGWWRRK